jgi:outer membrane receptor for Fe3+-dicitrate
VRPNFSLNASLGAELWKREKENLRLQVAGENLTDRLNLINFEGLFSGTAVAPPRSGSLRLQYSF